ncbi:hypothetical protein DPMN_167047 [Dreissena polymorpha]|uniref:Uncharacterized protein n=1 Tax=Dreissena polymorpha TaxID=45954 RepID=A0A9D4IYF2_DREPO|nr:hypothetical protein DPMN_167047 [Dreissena polymorpha]
MMLIEVVSYVRLDQLKRIAHEKRKTRYPFIHLGAEEQMWDKFLAQENSSGQGKIRTRDLSIPNPASYH